MKSGLLILAAGGMLLAGAGFFGARFLKNEEEARDTVQSDTVKQYATVENQNPSSGYSEDVEDTRAAVDSDESEENVFEPQSLDIIHAILAQWTELAPAGTAGSAPQRFWFSETHEAYVEYGAAGENVSRGMLFVVARIDENGALRVSRKTAYMLGETDWAVVEGEDARFQNPQTTLYERNQIGEWVRVN